MNMNISGPSMEDAFASQLTNRSNKQVRMQISMAVNEESDGSTRSPSSSVG